MIYHTILPYPSIVTLLPQLKGMDPLGVLKHTPRKHAGCIPQQGHAYPEFLTPIQHGVDPFLEVTKQY